MILSRLLLAIPDVLAAAVSADPSRCRRQAICPTAMRGLCTICEPLLVSLKLLWHYAHSKFFCSGTSPVRPVKCICRELIVVALCRLSYCDSAILGRSLLEAGSRRRDGCVASPGAPVITCREYCKRHLRLRVVCVSYAHFLCASRAARLPPLLRASMMACLKQALLSSCLFQGANFAMSENLRSSWQCSLMAALRTTRTCCCVVQPSICPRS